MSAYVVPVEHIRVLVQAGLDARQRNGYPLYWEVSASEEPDASGANGVHASGPYRRRELSHVSADTVGQILLSANVASVNHRYSEDEFEAIYSHKRPRVSDREPVEIIKAAHCLAYQSCEIPEWATSEAKTILDAIIRSQLDRLPGMSDAAWEIDEDTPTLYEERTADARARRAATEGESK